MKKTLAKISLLFTLLCSTFNIHSQSLYFGQPTNYSYPNQLVQTIDTGDFNNDGNLDIITGGGSLSGENYGIFMNQGNGTFTGTNYTPVSEFYSLVTGDFNNDNYTDFAILGFRKVDVHINNTNGGFNTPVSYSYDYNTRIYDISVGDFNGDGNKDIALITTLEDYENFTAVFQLQLLEGSGTGSFTSNPAGQLQASYASEFYRNKPGSVINVTTDINKDGNDDLIIDNNYDEKIIICYGSNTTPLQSASYISLSGLRYAAEYRDARFGSAGQVADLNGDTWPDLVVKLNFQIFIFLNDGQGAISSPSTITVSSNDSYDFFFETKAIAIGNFNTDNKPDIASENAGIVLGNNNNFFSNTSAFSLNSGYWSMVSADFNGDGLDDIIGSYTDAIQVLLQTTAPVPPTPVYDNLASNICLGSNVNVLPSIGGSQPTTYFDTTVVSINSPKAICKNDSNVFVLNANDSILRYDLNGNLQQVYNDGQIFMGITAMAADNDNKVYVVAPDNNNTALTAVYRLDANGGWDFGFGSTPPYFFSAISCIAVGPDGNVYVADTINGYVSSIDPATATPTNLPSPNPNFAFYKPVGMAFDKTARMLLADIGHKTILYRDVADNNYYPLFPDLASLNWNINAVDVDTATNAYYFSSNNPEIIAKGRIINMQDSSVVVIDTLSTNMNLNAPKGLAFLNTPGQLPGLWVANNGSSDATILKVFAYQITPSLPEGLKYDYVTGGIIGTATAPSPLTTYTITVSNNQGTTNITKSFAVDPPGPVSNAIGSISSSGKQTDGLTINYFEPNNCAEMLQIADKVGGQMPGNVEIKQDVYPTLSVFDGSSFVGRVTHIGTQTQSDSARVKIYYSYLDIQHYNQALGSVVLSNDTTLGTMQVAVLQMHEDKPGHSVPIKHSPLTATWSTTKQHWVVDFKIGEFSVFYMGDTSRVNSFDCSTSFIDSVTTGNAYYVWQGDTLYNSGTYIDTLSNASGCDSINTFKLTFDMSTSAPTPLLDKSLSIYPNPTTGTLNVIVNNPNVDINNIRIVNIIGNEIYNSSNVSSNTQINLNGLPKGFYLIQLTSQQEKITRRIIIE
ncbi:MAG: FG-GAP-like repeat-containing protein [Bacteroidia bacterium]